ncbi:MAG: AMP-binding protein, partial [Muribaculaceae bacterium]|nr:AMP-binding protein [Muribaculaceae bacterium]
MKEYQDLLEIYASSWQKNFDLKALSTYGESDLVTYGEFARNIARYHVLFEQAGLNKDSKVVVLGKSTPEWITIFMAAVTYGAAIVPILPEFNPQDLQHIINHSESELLFVSDRIWETLEFSDMTYLKAAISLDSGKLLDERDSEGRPILKILKNLTRKFNKKYPAGFKPDDIKYGKFDADHMVVLNYT